MLYEQAEMSPTAINPLFSVAMIALCIV